MKEKFKKYVPTIPSILANNLILKYYNKVNRARAEGKIPCWANLGVPCRFLYAFENLVPVYPQLHGEFHAVRGKFREMSDAIEGKWEVPRDICGEAKSVLALILYGNLISFPIPYPDLLITFNTSCLQAPQVFKTIGSHLKIPHYAIEIPVLADIDTPSLPSDTHSYVQYIKYIADQLKTIVSQIEVHFKIRFDEERFVEGIRYKMRLTLIWQEILRLFRSVPCPMDAQDLLLVSRPSVFTDFAFEGSDTLKMYISLYNELYKKIENDKRLNKKEENFRILWDMQPISAKKNFIKNILRKYDAAITFITLFAPGFYLFDTAESIFDFPLTAGQIEKVADDFIVSFTGLSHIGKFDRYYAMNFLAKFYLFYIDLKRSFSYICNKYNKLICDYHIDAVIMNVNRSCRMISSFQHQLMSYIKYKLNIPVLVLDTNPLDERCFSNAQMKVRLEAFMETLE